MWPGLSVTGPEHLPLPAERESETGDAESSLEVPRNLVSFREFAERPLVGTDTPLSLPDDAIASEWQGAGLLLVQGLLVVSFPELDVLLLTRGPVSSSEKAPGLQAGRSSPSCHGYCSSRRFWKSGWANLEGHIRWASLTPQKQWAEAGAGGCGSKGAHTFPGDSRASVPKAALFSPCKEGGLRMPWEDFSEQLSTEARMTKTTALSPKASYLMPPPSRVLW